MRYPAPVIFERTSIAVPENVIRMHTSQFIFFIRHYLVRIHHRSAVFVYDRLVILVQDRGALIRVLLSIRMVTDFDYTKRKLSIQNSESCFGFKIQLCLQIIEIRFPYFPTRLKLINRYGVGVITFADLHIKIGIDTVQCRQLSQ